MVSWRFFETHVCRQLSEDDALEHAMNVSDANHVRALTE